MDHERCSKVFGNFGMMNMMQTLSFFFFRANPKKNNSDSSFLPYSRIEYMVVSVYIPMAFGLNILLSIFDAFVPIWVTIMINVVVISFYITCIIPKFSKVFATWLNSVTARSVN